ncbi:MAG: hypothetical protein VX424_23625 [Actinomycetota bacterium]|nr:hypothetical protein [Actinomycetota bacterium]
MNGVKDHAGQLARLLNSQPKAAFGVDVNQRHLYLASVDGSIGALRD